MTTLVFPRQDFPPLLPTLWVVVMLNMLMADVLSLYIPGAQQAASEFAGSTPVSQLMLVSAIIMELPILMILLTRLLHSRAAQWANIVVAVLCIAFVVGGSAPYPHYLFIAAVEVVCLLCIIWQAWKWKGVASQSGSQQLT